MNKKETFNKDKRCAMCDGTLITTTGFPPAITLPIKNDIMKIRTHEEDENGCDTWCDIKDIPINFCPFCGCQLRKEIDWNLCD